MVAFLVTRIFTALTLRIGSVQFVINDISYYGANLWAMFEQGAPTR
ncbi:hypothetical protein G7085_19305 [Tessaracoccus sp. HDW20]|nr:hypothetical protein [Tessaracoccus coleopterorum]NHB85965.1 hypothetical protein [Tessaracoccus coleopterorum]